MSYICHYCCNKMNNNFNNTCSTCRSKGKYNISVAYGKLMNFNSCDKCYLPLIEPTQKWQTCSQCFYYIKRQERKMSKKI